MTIYDLIDRLGLVVLDWVPESPLLPQGLREEPGPITISHFERSVRLAISEVVRRHLSDPELLRQTLRFSGSVSGQLERLGLSLDQELALHGVAPWEWVNGLEAHPYVLTRPGSPEVLAAFGQFMTALGECMHRARAGEHLQVRLVNGGALGPTLLFDSVLHYLPVRPAEAADEAGIRAFS